MTRKTSRRQFSREFKVSAVKRLLNGEKETDVALELKVGREMLWKWKKTYVEQGEDQLHGPGRRGGSPGPKNREEMQLKRIAELERLVGRQQMEIRFLDKALRRVEELRQQDNELGEAASSKS